MCFMTFSGEKSGDIFDGFGDGNEGKSGEGGVNDKENERINSRAISFGSICRTGIQSYRKTDRAVIRENQRRNQGTICKSLAGSAVFTAFILPRL
uniref:Uncharacterized protein n=1 Tax=Caenorhabditis japonica TaxID=281687 RepID=A0A8R1IW11_CAEJA